MLTVVALWPDKPPPAVSGPTANGPIANGPFASGPAHAGAATLASALTARTPVRFTDARAVEAAPVPRTPAQAKLGGGQLLQAVLWFNQHRGVASGGAATVAAQIAALDRVRLPARYRDGEKIKINLRLALPLEQLADTRLINQATTALRDTLQASGVQARIIAGSPALEATVPLARLEAMAQLDQVAGVSLMVLPKFTAVTSAGVTLSGTDGLRALGGDAWSVPEDLRRQLNGEGTTIAMLDVFDGSGIAGLQDSGDWPKNSAAEPDKLVLIPAPGTQEFGDQDNHGNSVTEIVYDFAPAARYRAYQLITTADAVAAVQDAAGLNQDNVRQIAPRAQVINMSFGFPPGYSPGDGTSGSGELRGLYEAVAAARQNGVVVVEAAGNADGQYWDGDSTAAPVASTMQDFDPLNRDANGAPILDEVEVLHSSNPELGDCIEVGRNDDIAEFLAIQLRLAWNDWSTPDRATSVDYRLELVRWADEVTREVGGRIEVVTPAGWTLAAQSDKRQSGMAGDEPTEEIAYLPGAETRTRRCDAIYPPPGPQGGQVSAGGGIFGVRVVRKTPGNGKFLRLSTEHSFYWPTHSVYGHTIVAPADSPDVVAVGAIGLDGKFLQFSSQGPVLGPGGARPSTDFLDINPKPNLASYSRVVTQSSSPWSFGGTSAAAPHVAGLTLLALQYQRMVATANARWGSQDLAWRDLPEHAALAESTLVGTLLPAVENARFGAERYKQLFPELLVQRRQDLAAATLNSLYRIAQTNSDVGYDYKRGKGLLRFNSGAKSCFLASFYDPELRYRRWLTPPDPVVHSGVPAYDATYSQFSNACVPASAISQ